MKEMQLAELTTSIHKEHEEVVQCAKRSLEHARKAGALLIQVKEKLGHGNLDEWMTTNLDFSKRTAQAYMRVARNWEVLQEKAEAKAQGAADLSLETALRLLAKPKPNAKEPKPSEKLIPLSPQKATLPLSGQDPGIMHPRPLRAAEAEPGTDWHYASEKKDDQHEIIVVAPQIQQGYMTDQEVSAFHVSLVNAVRRLETLAIDASRIPGQHDLLEDIPALVSKGIASLTQLKETLTHE